MTINNVDPKVLEQFYEAYCVQNNLQLNTTGEVPAEVRAAFNLTHQKGTKYPMGEDAQEYCKNRLISPVPAGLTVRMKAGMMLMYCRQTGRVVGAGSVAQSKQTSKTKGLTGLTSVQHRRGPGSIVDHVRQIEASRIVV